MKKAFMGSLVLLLVAVGVAEAFIIVEVDSAGGSYVKWEMTQDAGWNNGIDEGSMWYVAWAGPDNTIDPTGVNTYMPSGDDKILTLDAGQTLPAISWTSSEYGQIKNMDPLTVYAPDGEADFTGKTGVYLRVFNTTNPAAGDHYVSGSINGSNTTYGAPWDTDVNSDDKLTEPPGAPETYEKLDMTSSDDAVAYDGVSGTHIELDSTIQAIPEPGTLGLLALGLAGVFAARRKRK